MIRAYNEAYPPRAFPNLWKRIEGMIDQGRMLMPDEVLNELEVGSDSVYHYAKSIIGFVVPLDAIQFNTARTIMNKYPNLVDLNTSKNSADPFLITLAQVKTATVISEERVRNDKQLKIPNICKWHGLRCIDFLGFLEEQEWGL